MQRGWSLTATAAGVIAQLAGLALDAWLHARDATLTAREGVFTLANPGHLLFAIGLALTVLGVGAALTARLPSAARARPRGARPAAALAGLVVLALAGAAVALAGGRGGHAHEAAVEVEHAHHASITISWHQLREVDRMLTEAKAASEKYRNVSIARADGFLQLLSVEAGDGAHFLHPALLEAGVFNPARPAILVYDRTGDGGLELVGVAWALPRRSPHERPPASPFGPLAHWHTHRYSGICIKDVGPDTEGVINFTPADCDAVNGVFIGETPWMLHAWLFRPSPDGLFSVVNPAVTNGGPRDFDIDID